MHDQQREFEPPVLFVVPNAYERLPAESGAFGWRFDRRTANTSLEKPDAPERLLREKSRRG
jgi:hypothetical protein